MGRLANKIVLVTGAAGAIGRAICAAIGREGGRAIGADLAAGDNAEHTMDVTSENDLKALAARLEESSGRLHGLVNAAGIAALGTVEDTDYATFRRVMAVNVDGTFLGCKYALPLLRKAGGAIVNLSSVSGLVGGHNLAAYNASKGAVRLLSKSVALHGARQDPQVRCNSVHPAFIEGPMVDEIISGTSHPDAARARMSRDIPLGRFGTPKEVSELCVYLLSDESRFVTGAEFVIDGGLTAR
jgi:3(or 17)beta-hydroxysteroid dehydrogenase